nr:ABC transporter substrate-binding protein [Oceanospirillum sediminis]
MISSGSRSDPRPEVIIIADDDYPPFSYRDGLRPLGIYPRILNRVFYRMREQYRIEIRPLPWRRGLIMMAEGTGFAIFPPYYFPDKRPYLEKYSVPIMAERVTLFCSKKYIEGLKHRTGRFKPVWPSDFGGAVIGINPGYLLLGEDFWKRHREGFYVIEEGINNQKNLLKLASGRMDCLVNSRMSVLWDIQQLKNASKLSVADIVQVHVLKEQHGYLAFSKNSLMRYPFREDFITQFNIEIKQLSDSGELQKLIDDFEKELLF